jgi:hypothetical protein
MPRAGRNGEPSISLQAAIAKLAPLYPMGKPLAEEKSYAQTYKAAVAVLSREFGLEADALKRAYVVLREHGKALCKRAAPICEPCPLDRACAHRPVTSRI